MAGQYGRCRTLKSSFRSWVFPLPATQPYFVKPLHIHGVPANGRYHFGGWNGRAATFLEHVRRAPRRPWRVQFGQVRLVAAFGPGSGGRGGQRVAQEAGRHEAATRARSYAHCGAEDRGAENGGKRNIFGAFAKEAIFGPKPRGAKRYAQRRIWNMSALKRIKLIAVPCQFCK